MVCVMPYPIRVMEWYVIFHRSIDRCPCMYVWVERARAGGARGAEGEVSSSRRGKRGNLQRSKRGVKGKEAGWMILILR